MSLPQESHDAAQIAIVSVPRKGGEDRELGRRWNIGAPFLHVPQTLEVLRESQVPSPGLFPQCKRSVLA